MKRKAFFQNKDTVTVFLMMAATVVSKLLGMVRQMLFAARFADSTEAVAFTAASSIPLSLFDILFGAAIGGCFIPVFVRIKKEDKERSERFISSFLTAVVLLSVLMACLGMIFSRQLIALIAPALSKETALLGARLLRIMMPSVIFTGIAFTFVGIFQSFERFILPAAVSSLSNIVLIICLALFSEVNEKSVTILAFVYMLSWLLQALVLVIPAGIQKMVSYQKPALKNKDLGTALSMAPSVMASAWLLPFSQLIATCFASFISDSAITVYHYAYNLFIIAVGILTYGICNFIFPKLSAQTEGNADAFEDTLGKALLHVWTLILPFTVGFFLLALPAVRILYMRGQFSEELARACASLLSLLSLSMPFYAGSEVLFRAFYAEKRPKEPAIASLCGILVCAGANLVFFSFSEEKLIFLAVSFLLAEITSFAVILLFARRRLKSTLSFIQIVKLIFCALFSGLCMYVARSFLVKITGSTAFIENILLFALVFLIGSVVYLLCIKGFVYHSRTK